MCLIFLLMNMDMIGLDGFMNLVSKKLPESKLCPKILSSQLHSREGKVSANTYVL